MRLGRPHHHGDGELYREVRNAKYDAEFHDGIIGCGLDIPRAFAAIGRTRTTRVVDKSEPSRRAS